MTSPTATLAATVQDMNCVAQAQEEEIGPFLIRDGSVWFCLGGRLHFAPLIRGSAMLLYKSGVEEAIPTFDLSALEIEMMRHLLTRRV